MSECLSRILFPFDTASFLKHYQTREYFHVGRNSPEHYKDLLSVADLDRLLQSEHLPAAYLNVVRDGTRYPLEAWSRIESSARGSACVAIPEKLFNLYSEGATLILNQADHAIPSLNSTCRALAVELGFPTHANVYITPRGAAGFAQHRDDHDVLIVQIAGSKRWLLHKQNAPVVELDLKAGDLLYLPRGLSHSARTQAGDSIHVTLGLRPVYAFQLIDDLAAQAAVDANFQQPQPPRLAGEEAKGMFETMFLRELRNLVERTKPSDLLALRFQSLLENQTQGWPGRLSDLRHVHDMTLETFVCMRPGILTDISDDRKFLKVSFAGKSVTIPGFLKGALDRILSGNTFAIHEIEGFIGGPGKIKLVSEFVKAGILEIVKI